MNYSVVRRYSVRITASARREIDKLPQDIRRLIDARILSLEQDPRPPGVTKLKGEEAYRVRVRDYRIVYTIEDQVKIVTVIRVRHRREVYR